MPEGLELGIEEQPEVRPTIVQREDRYKSMLLDYWETLATLETEFRSSYLNRQIEARILNQLISVSLTLWKELQPKMTGVTLKNGIFDDYRDLYLEPFWFFVYPKLIFKLIFLLREALENLGITVFEIAGQEKR